MADTMLLESLRSGVAATIRAIDWDRLDPACAARLRDFGFDEGVAIRSMHSGPFGRDPLAVKVGRMTVAIRRVHARAITIIPEAA
mgnify:CR=1 FL=1